MVDRRRGLVLAIAGLSLVALPVAAQPQAQGPDQQLVTRLHQLGQDEIVVAKMGEAQGVNPRVKAFALTVQRERQMANDALVAYADRKSMGASIAQPGGALEHGSLANAPLVNSPPAQFDYNFVNRMVADQQAAIDAAAAAQRLARDPELKGVIGRVMVGLSENLVSAQQLLAEIPAPPPPPTVPLPAYPTGVSRTQTGADVPPPGAWQAITP
jgi:predicted outer membrane protein